MVRHVYEVLSPPGMSRFVSLSPYLPVCPGDAMQVDQPQQAASQSAAKGKKSRKKG